MRRLLQVARDRKLDRVAVGYLVAAWVVVQAGSIALPAFDAPAWSLKLLIAISVVGFPVALLAAWVWKIHHTRDAEAGTESPLWARTDLVLIALLIFIVVTGALEFAYFFRTPAHEDRPGQQAVASIAVLPFDDLSPGHDHAYFASGLAEELLNALAKVQGLKVAGRASSFYYGNHNADLRTIGKALDVANVLQGAVRTQGNAVRISVQLVRVGDGYEVWSQSYDGSLSDIFDLQERIARAITDHLKVVLTGSEQARLVPVATTSAEAYADFVTAQTLVNQRVGDSLPRAIALLQKATTLDPRFTRAWSKLAVAYAVLPQYVSGDWKASWKISDDAAHRALVLDPNDAEAYAAMSYNQFSQRHYVAMVEPMQRAVELAPDNSAVNYWAANELAAMGRTRDAEARIDSALTNDPANILLLFYKSMTRWRQGDQAGALAYIHRAGVADSPFGALMLEFYDAARGDMAGSAREFANSTSWMGTKISRADLQAIYRGTYGDAAQRAIALKILDAHLDDDWTPTMLLQLGESARSFDLFEHGHSGLSDAYLNWLWQPEPWSRKARQDPVFQGFARRIGMVAYWKRYGWPDLCKPSPENGSEAFVCQ